MCWFDQEWSPQAHIFESLVTRKWYYLRRIRMYSFVEVGVVSLEEVSLRGVGNENHLGASLLLVAFR